MVNALATRIGALAALMAIGTSASAAVVTSSFITTNAALIDIYSTTLDNGNNTVLPNSTCTALAGDALQECQFFSGVPTPTTPSTNRKIQITQSGFNAGLSTGTLNVDWDNVTGEIVKVNSLVLNYQDIIINIAAAPGLGLTSSAVAIVTQGNSTGLSGAVANDQASSQSSNDLDTGLAIGQASIFQGGFDGGSTDNPDFSVFTDVVDSCVPSPAGASGCNLLGLLSIDADKYRIDGTLSASGGSFTLRGQTGNNSIYTSTFDATVVPAPPAAWLLLTGLGALVARRFRSRQ